MAPEAEPKFGKEVRREAGRRFQGVGSWKGDAKALCKQQEAGILGLCLGFGIEYIIDTQLIFVEPKSGFVTAWVCLFLTASKADQPSWFLYKIHCFRHAWGPSGPPPAHLTRLPDPAGRWSLHR